jgi:hypothetical protein
LVFPLLIVIFKTMTSNFKTYYYYAHIDPNKEALSTIAADDMGNAVTYFTALKNMNAQEFLKIYGIGVKNEHK